MDFLKNNKRLSFKIDNKDAFDFPHSVSQEEKGNELITTYSFECGIKVTNVSKKIGEFGAYEWVNYFENTASAFSPIISDIWDCDVELDFPYEAPLEYKPVHADKETTTKIYAPTGSTWTAEEFYCDPDYLFRNKRLNHLFPGIVKEYATSGGRSCEAQAPFFRVQKGNVWLTTAVGWSGQWKAQVSRTENTVIFKSGIEKTYFRMLAGEKFRTSSVVIMKDEGEYWDIVNRWRRLIKEQYSQAGKRCEQGPLSAMIWGGMTSEEMLRRVELIKENKLPYEYFWIDAGWYGMSKPSLNEYQGDWGQYTGDWRISPYTHPNGLKDVAKAVHDAGMKLLIWFEFERVYDDVCTIQEHPDWFVGGRGQKILNLGNPEAYEFELNTLREFIDKLGMDCYRQDFNASTPINEWRANDVNDRQGITEIKHINALYKLYDTILDEYPNLIIDNCASGGRRIDIEMMKRSIPLWRTDYYCPVNFDVEVEQMHQQLFSTWLPYHGAGIKHPDEYSIRSGYSSCTGTGFFFYGDAKEFYIDEQSKYLKEYLRVRPYFSQNFYALTEPSKSRDIWCASQYHDASKHEGIVQVFKRDKSSYDTSTYNLHEIDEHATYEVEDVDQGKTITSGKDLKNFVVTIKEKRTSKLFIYRKI